MIERYTYKERLCHWLSGLSYLYCLATGLAFYSPYLFWIAIMLGGGPASRYWHPFLGLLFFVAGMWMHNMWRADLKMTEADRAWLDKAGDYAANRDDLVPAQGRFNAGQKLFYWAMFYGTLLLVVSGIFMWFPEYVPLSVGWIRPIMVVIHECASLTTIGAFIIHIYMGVFVVPGSLTAMVHGRVTNDWARTHHRLWYSRVSGQGPGE
jgi:formate dehydrogenase subunit gamma